MLTDKQNMASTKGIVLEHQGSPSSGEEVSLWLKKDLDLSYKEALRRWPTSNMA